MTGLRISGIASGLDTEAIVSQLMKANRVPLDKLNQQKQILTWKQDVFRDINASLTKLRDKAFTLRLEGGFKVFSATPSDPSILSVNPAGNAAEGTYAVTVRQMATATKIASAAPVSLPLKSNADIDVATANLAGKNFNLTLGTVTKEIGWSSTEGAYADINSLASAVQAKVDNAFGSNQITVGVDGNRLVFNSAHPDFKQNIIITDGTTTALTDLKFTSGSRSLLDVSTKLENLLTTNGQQTSDVDDKVKFSINGVSFEFAKTSTIQDVINKVNSDTKANVNLAYDSAKDSFTLTRKDTGSGKDIVITEGTGSNFFSVLGINQLNSVQGTNAIFDYTKNGVLYSNMENSANNFDLEGINYSFHKADIGTNVSFSVNKNVDKVFENIKQFVDQYNETMELLNGKLSEKRYRSYVPLTDEQKKDMKEKEIELWEEKAKSGVLANDTQLQGIVNSLRSAWANPVGNVNPDFDILNEVGLKLGNYSEKGKVYIDEEKLKATIASNLDDVMRFFNNTPTAINGGTLSNTVSLTGKDFQVNWNGVPSTINVTGDYDVNTLEGRNALLAEVRGKIDTNVGVGNILLSFNSQNQLQFSTSKVATFELLSGGNDALAALGVTSGAKYDSASLGLAQEIYRYNNETITNINQRAGLISSLDKGPLVKEMEDVDRRIERMNDRLISLEDGYYRKFAALEKAMSQLSSQSSWLMQQLGVPQQ